MTQQTPASSLPEGDDTVHCSTHGPSSMTFVCSHLAESPAQRWHCAYPEDDDPWPDAWCDACNVAFEREGEWNERNEGELKAVLLCSHCYDEGMASSVDRLAGEALANWDAWADECFAALKQKQGALLEQHDINSYARWDYEQETARLIFSDEGRADLVADIEFVGTLSTVSNTWKWAWANFSLLEPVRSRIAAVRDVGEARDYPHLLVPLWLADESDGWCMAGVAAEVMGALGAYRVPSDQGFIYMVILGVRLGNEAMLPRSGAEKP